MRECCPFGLSFPIRRGEYAARSGFSLLEVLTVLSIFVVMVFSATMTIPSVMAEWNMRTAVQQMSGLLKAARARAMAENTYVIVCFSLPSAASHSDLQVATYSTVDGSFLPGSTSVVQETKIVHLANVSLCPIGNLGASVTNNLNAGGITSAAIGAGLNVVDCQATLSPPTITPSGTTLVFNELIAFSPQGEAILVPASGTVIGPTTPYYSQIFLGLCPARGGSAINASLLSSALVLDGGTGRVEVYQP